MPPRLRLLAIGVGVSVALLLTIVLSLSQGAVQLSLSDLWQALNHQGESMPQTIVWDLRIPRIVIGLLVGSALGMSGAMLQGMLRNSLADASILGISSGAG
ncbi:MAG: iron ABC transporter permease, partial [Alkalinema sp. RL_2_19]|nr:iron ABC transporter permease [Alkalinema sp. RL_2_19]